MSLPDDDFILLSLVNTFLRDGGEIEDFCARYCAETEEIFARLSAAGYSFDEGANAFKRG